MHWCGIKLYVILFSSMSNIDTTIPYRFSTNVLKTNYCGVSDSQCLLRLWLITHATVHLHWSLPSWIDCTTVVYIVCMHVLSKYVSLCTGGSLDIFRDQFSDWAFGVLLSASIQCHQSEIKINHVLSPTLNATSIQIHSKVLYAYSTHCMTPVFE